MWYSDPQEFWETFSIEKEQFEDLCTVLASREDASEVDLEIDIYNMVSNRAAADRGFGRRFSRHQLWEVFAPVTLLKKVRKVKIRGAIRPGDAKILEAHIIS